MNEVRAALLIIFAALAACRGGGSDPPSGAARGSDGKGEPVRIVSLSIVSLSIVSLSIVSLSPSATEVVAALGATKLLVGVDDYSDFPDEVKALPKVGNFLGPNLEVIVPLRPTFVIVDDIHGSTAGALHDAGIATLECPMHALPDVKAALRKVGSKLGKTVEAEAVIAGIDAAIDKAWAARPAKHPRVLAIIDREAGGLGNLVAVGPGTWLDELLAIIGAENVLAASGVRYPKIGLEEVLRGEPDVILDVSFAGKGGVEVWKQLDIAAVRNGRVHALGEGFLQHPSPRVSEALETLARAIR